MPLLPPGALLRTCRRRPLRAAGHGSDETAPTAPRPPSLAGARGTRAVCSRSCRLPNRACRSGPPSSPGPRACYPPRFKKSWAQAGLGGPGDAEARVAHPSSLASERRGLLRTAAHPPPPTIPSSPSHLLQVYQGQIVIRRLASPRDICDRLAQRPPYHDTAPLQLLCPRICRRLGRAESWQPSRACARVRTTRVCTRASARARSSLTTHVRMHKRAHARAHTHTHNTHTQEAEADADAQCRRDRRLCRGACRCAGGPVQRPVCALH